MKYQRPDVVAVASALVVIKSSTNKGPFTPVDCLDVHATSSAYEADE